MMVINSFNTNVSLPTWMSDTNLSTSTSTTTTSPATLPTNSAVTAPPPIPYTLSYAPPPLNFNLLNKCTMNTAYNTMIMPYIPPNACTDCGCAEKKILCANSPPSFTYLSAECNVKYDASSPYILPPKHSICDPTQSVGVFAPLWPQLSMTLPTLVELPTILPSSSVKVDANAIGKPLPQKPSKPNESKTNIKEERPFKCPQCNKSFRNKSGLSNHKVIHRKVKPHKCKFKGCGKAFARSCDLTRHTRLHTGIKPFKCTFGDCKKAFTRSVQLRLHMMDHTGVRPHKCTLCKKGFKTLQNMQIHMVPFVYSLLYVLLPKMLIVCMHYSENPHWRETI